MLDLLTRRTPAPRALTARRHAAKMAHELRLVEQARNAGIDNLPSRKDQEPDRVQHEIVDHGFQALEQLRHGTALYVNAQAECAARFNPAAAANDIAAAEQAAGQELRRLDAEARATVVDLLVEERRRWRELSAFRHEHRLGRDACYPQSWLWAGFVAAAILMAETFANASLFAAGSEFGILGGWLDAASFALPNFLLSLSIGLIGLRYAGHVQSLKRYFGLAYICGVGSLVVAYNLWLAHYRELLAVAPDSARAGAMHHLMADPWNVSGGDSLVLLLLGLVAAIAAMADGYLGFADRYVGYAAVDCRYRVARSASQQAHARFRNDVAAVVSRAVAALARIEQAVHRQCAPVLERLGQAECAVLMFGPQAGNIERATDLALRLYRETNMRVRSTPAPAYFGIYPAWDPNIASLSVDPSADPRLLRQQVTSGLAVVQQQAAAARTRLHQAGSFLTDRLEAFAAHAAATVDEHGPAAYAPASLQAPS